MSSLKENYNCSVELVMDLIGGKWKFRILWFLNMETKRFSELKRSIPDITQKMLTTQLREMESQDLISRKVYAEVPPKVEYSITKYGKSLEATLHEMCTWGNKYALDHHIEIQGTK